MSSGRPSTAQSSPHWSAPPQASATTTQPSAVGKAWKGTAVGWRVPSFCGSWRRISQRMKAFSWIAICASIIEMSTSWPRPERSRSWSAARIPIAA